MSENSTNSTISRLIEENNHLTLQLSYERSLRNKYEEESNRLHIIKIGKFKDFYIFIRIIILLHLERDQLLGEKINIEKYLKDLVEQYKVILLDFSNFIWKKNNFAQF